jgi:hypothetical protein
VRAVDVVRTDSKHGLLNAVSLVSAAERLLLQAISTSTDPSITLKLNAEYSRLDALLSHMLRAQAFVDGPDFAYAIAALKKSVDEIQASEDDSVESLPSVILGSTIANYKSQALSLIASL